MRSVHAGLRLYSISGQKRHYSMVSQHTHLRSYPRLSDRAAAELNLYDLGTVYQVGRWSLRCGRLGTYGMCVIGASRKCSNALRVCDASFN